jgi:hypothetical protein
VSGAANPPVLGSATVSPFARGTQRMAGPTLGKPSGRIPPVEESGQDASTDKYSQDHQARVVSVTAAEDGPDMIYHLTTQDKGPLTIWSKYAPGVMEKLPAEVKAMKHNETIPAGFTAVWRWKKAANGRDVRQVRDIIGLKDDMHADRARVQTELMKARGIELAGRKVKQIRDYVFAHEHDDMDMDQYTKVVHAAIDEVKGKPEYKYSPFEWDRWIRGLLAEKCRRASILNNNLIDPLIKEVFDITSDRPGDDEYILDVATKEIEALDKRIKANQQEKAAMVAPATTNAAPVAAAEPAKQAFVIEPETRAKIDKFMTSYKVDPALRDSRIKEALYNFSGTQDEAYKIIYLHIIDEYGYLKREQLGRDVSGMFKAAGYDYRLLEAIGKVNIDAALDIEPTLPPSGIVTGVRVWIKDQEDKKPKEEPKLTEVKDAEKLNEKASPAAQTPIAGNDGQQIENKAPVAPVLKPEPAKHVELVPCALFTELKTLTGIPMSKIQQYINRKHDPRYYKDIKAKNGDKKWTDLDPVAVRKRFDKVFGFQGMGWRIVPATGGGQVTCTPFIQTTQKGERQMYAVTMNAYVLEYALVD